MLVFCFSLSFSLYYRNNSTISSKVSGFFCVLSTFTAGVYAATHLPLHPAGDRHGHHHKREANDEKKGHGCEHHVGAEVTVAVEVEDQRQHHHHKRSREHDRHRVRVHKGELSDLHAIPPQPPPPPSAVATFVFVISSCVSVEAKQLMILRRRT